jgi:antitoxin (DNA-binding transcriptional repressor) of toxin-antitoxin stability system
MAVIRFAQKTGKLVLITKQGKPLAKLIPVDDDIFGYLSGKVKIVDDIVRTTTLAENWDK